MDIKTPFLPELASQFGLTKEEYGRVLLVLGRDPTLTELGIFSVMWSEHCSYKSSRVWLKTLPTQAPWVLQGPGENAGVVDIGDNLAAVFKMESHNHPSYIEPYQGAATGVGGIMRDIFTMGARPVANLNALRFGSPDNPQTRRIVDGVVRGIGGYGNCMGVPTVGGEINFHSSYNSNPLVNAMTVGIAPKDKIFLSAAVGVGNTVVYVGSSTGRDGIHGATMASAQFGDDASSKRPTVQVGDPFVEKLLLEACLELMATGVVVAIQDMGAAGLTSSTVEMASKGGVGIDINLDKVPQREMDMTGYEIMLSESQERMLVVIHPAQEELARSIFDKWELDFAVIGHLTDTSRIVVHHKGKIQADIPLEPLVNQAPVYCRPYERPVSLPPLGKIKHSIGLKESLLTLLSCPDLASREWVWNQYDSTVGGMTIMRPGSADAAVVGLEGSQRGLAMTTDCTPRYCAADPYVGGAQAVAEAWRNLIATGAHPLAVTDNLNFANPENPQVMGQLVAAIEGIGEACRTLAFPVVSGNVSLYNETLLSDGRSIGILPTPVIGAIGVFDDVNKAIGFGMPNNCDLVLIGETRGELGQSLWLREIGRREEGPPPVVDCLMEYKNGRFIEDMIASGQVMACHDLSDGGLLVGIAEMAMSTGVGCNLEQLVGKLGDTGFWFGEDQARYLIAVKHAELIFAYAADRSIDSTFIGYSGGNNLVLPTGEALAVESMCLHHRSFFPNMMSN